MLDDVHVIITFMTDKNRNIKDLDKGLDAIADAHKIQQLFIGVRDASRKGSKKFKEAQYEVDAFNFVLRDGQVSPMFTGTDAKGQYIEYPSIIDISTEQVAYYKKRWEKAQSKFAKYRYGFILWNSTEKHNKYASSILEQSEQLIDLYTKQDLTSPDKHKGLSVLNVLKSAFLISKNSKIEQKEWEDNVVNAIRTYPSISSSSYALRAELIELMLSNNFEDKYFSGMVKIIEETAKQLLIQHKIDFAISYYRLGKQIYIKQGKNTNKWDRFIAKLYEKLMKNALKDSSFIWLTYCQEAIALYKAIGNEKKVSQLSKIFSKQKSSVKLDRISTEADLSPIIEAANELASKIVTWPTDAIIQYLIHDASLLPSAKRMNQLAKKSAKEFVFTHIANSTILDRNMNVSKTVKTEEEKHNHWVYFNYGFDLEGYRQFLINDIFALVLQSNPEFIWEVLEYLNNKTWYGKELRRGSEKFHWISLIAPGIIDYLTEMQKYTRSHIAPNFTLSIESLSLKVEGIIRDLFSLKGLNTTTSRRDAKGDIVTQERRLDDLLRDPQINELISEDDVLFLKYVYIEKQGYNLRHNIAHALSMPHSYHIFYANLVFLSILRLGRYSFKSSPKKKQPPTKT